MPLTEIRLEPSRERLPADVAAFLREAERRLRRVQSAQHSAAFVPSDFVGAYRALRALSERGLARGAFFCEWGSGLGVVACLAALLDFDACGIEIEPALVAAAQRLARDFELPAQFACGSFIPAGAIAEVSTDSAFAWLTTDSTEPIDDPDGFGLDVDDFDVIFAYPWPDEEHFTAALFERYAAPGALLLTHHSTCEFRLRRKVRK
jgi:hypothetical protein